jgi:quinol monooxygenase YgiN
MFFELRQYTCFPGKRDEWVEYMESVVIPFQASKGMVVVGSFVDEEDEDRYYWIRRFADEDERKQLYAAVYESDEWKEKMSPRVGELLDREKIVVRRIVPTPKSIIE